MVDMWLCWPSQRREREIKFSRAANSLYTLDEYNIVKCAIAQDLYLASETGN